MAGAADLTVNSDTPLIPGAYGNVVVTQQAILTLAPGAYSINSLTLGGGSKVTTSGAPVVLKVAGSNTDKPLDLSGGSIVDSAGNPASLIIIYGGAKELDLTGQADSYGLVYAPAAAVKLTGNADWFGALVVGTLTDAGNSKIHYDRNVAQ